MLALVGFRPRLCVRLHVQVRLTVLVFRLGVAELHHKNFRRHRCQNMILMRVAHKFTVVFTV